MEFDPVRAQATCVARGSREREGESAVAGRDTGGVEATESSGQVDADAAGGETHDRVSAHECAQLVVDHSVLFPQRMVPWWRPITSPSDLCACSDVSVSPSEVPGFALRTYSE